MARGSEKRKARESVWDAKYNAEYEAASKKAARFSAAMELLSFCEDFPVIVEEAFLDVGNRIRFRAIMARAKEAL